MEIILPEWFIVLSVRGTECPPICVTRSRYEIPNSSSVHFTVSYDSRIILSKRSVWFKLAPALSISSFINSTLSLMPALSWWGEPTHGTIPTSFVHLFEDEHLLCSRVGSFHRCTKTGESRSDNCHVYRCKIILRHLFCVRFVRVYSKSFVSCWHCELEFLIELLCDEREWEA